MFNIFGNNYTVRFTLRHPFLLDFSIFRFDIYEFPSSSNAPINYKLVKHFRGSVKF